MFRNFIKFIGKEKLFEPDQRVMLAVSGGMDSMAMLSLFRKARFLIGVAHCNFRLRGEASDQDEAFVRSVATREGIPFFSTRFDTKEYAKSHGISVQMAARDLRYDWFRELILNEGYDYIATAHHLDDQEETFFINLLRSSGLAGFHGISIKQDKLIRPMLFLTRKEIEAYIRKNNIAWREDHSNRETKYLRNKIRHELIPVFHEINPEFPALLHENISRIREVELIFRKAVEEERKRMVVQENGEVRISIPELKKLVPLNTFVYEFISPYNFNFSVCMEVVQSLDETETKIFFSPTHQLVKDRNHLVITLYEPANKINPSGLTYKIASNRKNITKPVKLSLLHVIPDKTFSIYPSGDFAYFDFNKLTFPLTIRKWEKGDFFHPFGQSNRKKLSDFFTDNKFSRVDKENAWLLCSGEKIIWIIGHRSDHRYRVTSKTTEVLVIHKEE